MGLFRLGVTGVFLLLSGYASTVLSADNLGVITLINGDGKTKCTISVLRGNHNYQMADKSCGNDNVYNFELSGLPAGVLIKFCDEKNCSEPSNAKNGWVYQIKTLKRDSSLASFELDKFDGSLVGAIPHRSFQMVYVHENSGQQIHGKLSRVEVKYCTASDPDPCPENPVDP